MRASATTWWTTPAFTLVELLVVLTMIGILTAIVLPTMVGLFTAGGDAQAYNALAGQLAAARGLAIQQRTYAGVHAQRADPDGTYTKALAEDCFTAVVWDDPDVSGEDFVLAEGFSPQKLPSSMAFGRVDAPFFNGGQYVSTEVSTDRFTSLTFVFAPNGQLVSGRALLFLNNEPVFNDPDSRVYLWSESTANDADCRESVTAAVMFDYHKFAALPEADRPAYLTTFGQLVAVNLYTGTPLGR